MTEVQDLTAYYEKYLSPNPKAKNLVCIPGVGCGAWVFKAFLPLLIDDFNLILINQPGVMDAPAWPEITIEKIADLVTDICEKEQIKNPSIMGHSMGGFVAQYLSLYVYDVPDLVLISTSYGATTLDRDSLFLMQKISAKSWGKRIHLHPSALYEFAVSKKTHKEHPHFFTELRTNYGAKAPEESVIWQHFFCGMNYTNMTKAHSITSRTLVVQGAEDLIVSRQSGRLLAGQIPNAEYLEVQNAGHFVFLEKKEILHSIKNFLLGAEVGVKVKDMPNNNFFAQAEEQSWRFKQEQLLKFYNPETFDILKWLSKL